MDAEVLPTMPGTDEALKLLDAMEAEEAGSGEQGAKNGTGQSATEEAQRAEPGDKTEVQANTEEKLKAEKLKAETEDKSKADAEAKAKADTDEKLKAEKLKAETDKNEAGKSRYARAQERLQGGWTELNAEKTAIKAERDALAAEREKIAAERREFDGKRQEAEQEFSPDQYDAAARKFEREGKFDLAELAKAKAEALRKNPPPPKAAADETQRKEWAMKAGTDFPELTKDRSPLQVRVAQLFQEEPDLKVHPKGIYVAARIADLEAQVAKGRALETTVAAKDKELGEARAKIKELEALTAPGGGNGVTRLPAVKDFAQMSSDEQLADLQRTAEEAGSIR